MQFSSDPVDESLYVFFFVHVISHIFFQYHRTARALYQSMRYTLITVLIRKKKKKKTVLKIDRVTRLASPDRTYSALIIDGHVTPSEHGVIAYTLVRPGRKCLWDVHNVRFGHVEKTLCKIISNSRRVSRACIITLTTRSWTVDAGFRDERPQSACCVLMTRQIKTWAFLRLGDYGELGWKKKKKSTNAVRRSDARV